MSIVVIFGTRPEAIKLGPVVAELRLLGVDVRVLCTGQHTDLLRGTPVESDLADSESCGLASDGGVMGWITRAQATLTKRLRELAPSIVVVQGDTMSASAGASAAALLGIPVAHVEAGVRSHNLSDPWPEEQTRVGISQQATWHYAATSTAFSNLVAESVPPETIRVTGNTVVSALARYTRAMFEPTPDDLVVVTLHRREVQKTLIAADLWLAIRAWALASPSTTFLWPMHPAFRKLVELGPAPNNLVVATALPYETFAMALSRARLLVTDSGGAVEEAATLGVPTVVLRRANDRPEAVEAGVATQATPDAAGVLEARAVFDADEIPRRPTTAFGGVESAAIIARHLALL